ncbi:MAG: FecR domain-containing protein, partial [Bacteroidia bacterium]|nr:FecR domain-containing protein [Bacteroidia bacterium]
MKKDQTHIDQKLLVLYLLDEISQHGRRKVESWLEYSEANRIYFESLRKTWEETGKIEPETVAFDTNRAWERMNGRIVKDVTGVKGVTDMMANRTSGTVGATRGRPQTPAFRSGFQTGVMRFVLPIAAIMIFGVMSLVFIRFLQNRQDAPVVTLASYAVPVQDTLTDGSTMVLNADTRLIVPKKFGQTNRTVELQGEAFFQVQHDAGRPFIIHAGPGQVKVLGTSFHVKAYPGSDLEVYVETGRVELSA